MNTNNINVYNDIATSLQQYTNQYLLPDKYSYGNNGGNFAATAPLNSLMGKIVVMVNESLGNQNLQNSRLYEFTNIITGGAGTTPYFQYQSFYNILNGNQEDIIDYAKMKTIFVYPDAEYGAPSNPDPTTCLSSGIQFIGMAYQTFDNNLEAYEAYFNNKKCAFVMKNESLLPLHYVIDVELPDEDTNPNQCYYLTVGDTTCLASGPDTCSGTICSQ
jgi:hypothetical protein